MQEKTQIHWRTSSTATSTMERSLSTSPSRSNSDNACVEARTRSLIDDDVTSGRAGVFEHRAIKPDSRVLYSLAGASPEVNSPLEFAGGKAVAPASGRLLGRRWPVAPSESKRSWVSNTHIVTHMSWSETPLYRNNTTPSDAAM